MNKLVCGSKLLFLIISSAAVLASCSSSSTSPSDGSSSDSVTISEGDDQQQSPQDELGAATAAAVDDKAATTDESPSMAPVNEAPQVVELEKKEKQKPQIEKPVKVVQKLPAKKAQKESGAESKSSGKGSFKKTVKNCDMKSKPNAKSKVLTNVSKGKKLWVEDAGKFYKVFRTKDVGYLSKSCFSK